MAHGAGPALRASRTTELAWRRLADGVPAHVRNLLTGAVVGTSSAVAAGILGMRTEREVVLHAFQGFAYGMWPVCWCRKRARGGAPDCCAID